MTRYFFDLRDGKDEPDETGTELQSDVQAQQEAARLFAEMVLDDPNRFISDDQRSVCVRTEDGLTLFTVSMLMTRTPASMTVAT